MRTTVYTDRSDPDETDEFPGCAASVDPGSGELDVVDAESLVQATYGPGEWVSVETHSEEG